MTTGLRIRRAAGACAVSLVALATAAGAGTSKSPPSTTSGNWSGYAVSGHSRSFTDVTGSWTQPAVACRHGGSSSSSFWIGLGGFAPTATGVEQIGTSADCESGQPVYYAWYELAPQPAVVVKLDVAPGDRLAAEVSVTGNAVTVWLIDVTQGGAFASTRHVEEPDLSSAEWIAEAPSACASSCRVLPLANFGATKFTATSATSGSHTGTITDAAWSASSIELTTRRSDLAGATPSHLSTDGSSFTVATGHARTHHHRRR
jgi:hypothetical protein